MTDTTDGDRIQFECKDCGEEVDRERRDHDLNGLTPVRCESCVLSRLIE